MSSFISLHLLYPPLLPWSLYAFADPVRRISQILLFPGPRRTIPDPLFRSVFDLQQVDVTRVSWRNLKNPYLPWQLNATKTAMKPLILDFAVRRSEDHFDVKLVYSPSKSLCVVVAGETEIPLVDLNKEIATQYTETRQAREQTDQDPFISTETKTARETSETSSLLLELETKTFKSRETDDERFNYY
jgi:hypothetical protein